MDLILTFLPSYPLVLGIPVSASRGEWILRSSERGSIQLENDQRQL